ncbi:MAG TPA: YraN family protein [Candidatus Omnitrophota bacterium]|nr:YraN family protein [Candidatus Omnitrophota bacterium]
MARESKDRGVLGEELACDYLSLNGFQILEKNFRSQQGEIDIVARDGRFLVFVEVKNYSDRSYGSPLGAIGKGKRQSIIHAAKTYLLRNRIQGVDCRFDVIAIYSSPSDRSRVEHIKDAFYVD